MNRGIEIWMRKKNSVTIDPDGTTATIGGGALSKELVDALWAANKQTGQSKSHDFISSPMRKLKVSSHRVV